MTTDAGVTFDRVFATVATIATVAGIIAGFWVLGTPERQRSIAADRQRLQDLQSIAANLHRQFQQQDEGFQLPTNLEASQRQEDPLTGQAYDYQRLSESTFELCAEFDTDSSTYPFQNTSDDSEFWQHPQGQHCFEFDVAEQPPSIY